MDCELFARFIDAYVDDEFVEAERLEIEAHLLGCADCRRLMQQRGNDKTLLRAATPRLVAPEGMRRRISALLDHMDREAPPLPPPPPPWLPAQSSWQARLLKVALPVALLVLPWMAYRYGHREPPMLADTVAKHQRNLPVEIAGNAQVVLSWFNGKVPFAVRPPRLEPNASLRGGRLISLGNHEAAYLLYERPGDPREPRDKISVFVFDAPDLALAGPRRQMIGSHEIFLQGSHGYSVAVFRDHGLDYAITGDMDEPELLRLIATAIAGR